MKSAMRIFLPAAIVALALTFSAQANAEMSISDYEKLKSNDVVKFHISGIGQGFSWSNTYQEKTGGHALYCEPGRLSMNTDNYVQILDQEIEKKIYPSTFPVSLVLLQGLIKTFPCK